MGKIFQAGDGQGWLLRITSDETRNALEESTDMGRSDGLKLGVLSIAIFLALVMQNAGQG